MSLPPRAPSTQSTGFSALRRLQCPESQEGGTATLNRQYFISRARILGQFRSSSLSLRSPLSALFGDAAPGSLGTVLAPGSAGRRAGGGEAEGGRRRLLLRVCFLVLGVSPQQHVTPAVASPSQATAESSSQVSIHGEPTSPHRPPARASQPRPPTPGALRQQHPLSRGPGFSSTGPVPSMSEL